MELENNEVYLQNHTLFDIEVFKLPKNDEAIAMNCLYKAQKWTSC